MLCEEYHGLSRYGANVPCRICRNWFKKVMNVNTTIKIQEDITSLMSLNLDVLNVKLCSSAIA